MTNTVDQIVTELQSMGHETTVFQSPYGTVVSFPYTIPLGNRKDETCLLGISLHGNQHYPEYPPHWIHLHPPMDDGKGGATHLYKDSEGREWLALSRPPTDVWDKLRTKTMHVYMSDHLSRFWVNL